MIKTTLIQQTNHMNINRKLLYSTLQKEFKTQNTGTTIRVMSSQIFFFFSVDEARFVYLSTTNFKMLHSVFSLSVLCPCAVSILLLYVRGSNIVTSTPSHGYISSVRHFCFVQHYLKQCILVLTHGLDSIVQLQKKSNSAALFLKKSLNKFKKIIHYHHYQYLMMT